MVSYQSMLRNELGKRASRNPRYSLRSFARDLQVSQPFLSQVLNGKRKLSEDNALKLAERTSFNLAQRKLFVNLVRLERVKREESRSLLQAEVQELLQKKSTFKLLAEDVFTVIAEWHYFAILELTALPDFRDDASWVARKLGLKPSHARAALLTLKSLGLLVEENGRWRKIEKDYIFEKTPSSAIRKHHQGTLELARAALHEQPVQEREFFTVCFPMDPAAIAHAKKRIQAFCAELMEELQETPPKSVYKLAVQFFRLDKE